MIITNKMWDRYIKVLKRIDEKTADLMSKKVVELRRDGISGEEGARVLIEYAYALATKYGEASAEAACEMYDAIALLSNAKVRPAVPAKTASYAEAAQAVNGTLMISENEEMVGAAVGRLAKMAGADTVLQNAKRDSAQFAWIPVGDTCAYCITMAGEGWQPAYRAPSGHAPHIHANCDCTYAVRFNPDTEYQDYNPDKYKEMYDDAPLDKWNTPDGKPPEGHEYAEKNNSRNKINAMRREFYAENKAKINAQKRSAYAKRKELESSEAEEINVD